MQQCKFTQFGLTNEVEANILCKFDTHNLYVSEQPSMNDEDHCRMN